MTTQKKSMWKALEFNTIHCGKNQPNIFTCTICTRIKKIYTNKDMSLQSLFSVSLFANICTNLHIWDNKISILIIFHKNS